METLLRDVECSLRMFRRSPAFTVTAVAALAIGIGANATVFSVVNTVLLRPVSAPDPDRVVEFLDMFKSGPPGPLAADIEFNLWLEHVAVFQDISGYTFRAVRRLKPGVTLDIAKARLQLTTGIPAQVSHRSNV
jgi:putative ABC transport system permease protein